MKPSESREEKIERKKEAIIHLTVISVGLIELVLGLASLFTSSGVAASFFKITTAIGHTNLPVSFFSGSKQLGVLLFGFLCAGLVDRWQFARSEKQASRQKAEMVSLPTESSTFSRDVKIESVQVTLRQPMEGEPASLFEGYFDHHAHFAHHADVGSVHDAVAEHGVHSPQHGHAEHDQGASESE